MPTPPLADEVAFAAVEAVREHGSQTAAARALGIPRQTLQSRLSVASRLGEAPGHFVNGVAPGYLMGKVTVQRAADGAVERTWERQSPDQEATRLAMESAAAAMAEKLPRVRALTPPVDTNDALCNLYVLTDSHVGMLAWGRETGADWDLGIAERVLTGCFMRMVDAAPKAADAVVCQLGDFLHFDSLTAVTPAHGHILDADGRFSKVVAIAIRVLRRVIDYALAKHDRVHVVMAEGNHDEASSVWLRLMFAALYENEPRVAVNDSELPYYVHQHGDTMLAFHHGHKRKNEQLPLLFAAQFPTMWGATTKRYCHTGHRHHEETKEQAGMKVTQHPTLAAKDAYAARGGWLSERQASAITYHSRYGKVGETIVTPEMLEAA